MEREMLTDLLTAVGRGESDAYARAFALLYEELRAVAHGQLRRWPDDRTLGTTALVHEAYLKLVQQKRITTQSRSHFLALASRAMRHVLTNYALSRRAQKRGGGVEPIPLHELALPVNGGALADDAAAEVLDALHRALERLEVSHARSCRVVECRFYGGLTIEETAEALGASSRTVKRDWAYAQAWLNRELSEVVSA